MVPLETLPRGRNSPLCGDCGVQHPTWGPAEDFGGTQVVHGTATPTPEGLRYDKYITKASA